MNIINGEQKLFRTKSKCVSLFMKTFYFSKMSEVAFIKSEAPSRFFQTFKRKLIRIKITKKKNR